MSSTLLPLAVMALVPVMIGPLPAERAVLTAALCNGGTVTIPLERDAPEDPRDCHPKGCHAGSCRERPKRTI